MHTARRLTVGVAVLLLAMAARAMPAGAASTTPVPVTLNEIIRAASAEMSGQNALTNVAYP